MLDVLSDINRSFVVVDVNKLYNKLLLKAAIGIALERFHEQTTPPKIRSFSKKLVYVSFYSF